MNGTETRPNDSRTTTEHLYAPILEPSKLIVELSNLSEGSMRTVKHDLKVLIEGYGHAKMISRQINVTEGK